MENKNGKPFKRRSLSYCNITMSDFNIFIDKIKFIYILIYKSLAFISYDRTKSVFYPTKYLFNRTKSL